MYSAVCRNNLSPKPNRSATRRYALRSPVVGVVSTVLVTCELLSIADIVGFTLIFGLRRVCSWRPPSRPKRDPQRHPGGMERESVHPRDHYNENDQHRGAAVTPALRSCFN